MLFQFPTPTLETCKTLKHRNTETLLSSNNIKKLAVIKQNDFFIQDCL